MEHHDRAQVACRGIDARIECVTCFQWLQVDEGGWVIDGDGAGDYLDANLARGNIAVDHADDGAGWLRRAGEHVGRVQPQQQAELAERGLDQRGTDQEQIIAVRRRREAERGRVRRRRVVVPGQGDLICHLCHRHNRPGAGFQGHLHALLKLGCHRLHVGVAGKENQEGIQVAALVLQVGIDDLARAHTVKAEDLPLLGLQKPGNLLNGR